MLAILAPRVGRTRRSHAPQYAATTAWSWLALAAVLGALPAAACTIDPLPQFRQANETYFIAAPLAESVEVGPPGWCAGCPAAVGAQLARLTRVGGARAAEVESAARAAGGRIALVPWSTRADCSPEPWQKPLPYWHATAPGVFTALLRERAAWRDGLPTFDVHAAYLEPYPYGEYLRPSQRAPGGGFELTVEQYFSLYAALPERAAYGRDRQAATQGIRSWKAAHPEWAARAPAAAILAQFAAEPTAATTPGALPADKLRRE